MAKLASLVVDLQIQSAQLRAGLDEANAKLDGFAKKAEGLGKVLDVALAGEAIKKLGEFVLKGAEAADKMGKLAQSAGAPVEEFSKLAYAADLSGSSAEDLSGSLQKLSRNMAEGFGGGKQASLFKALGVSIVDTTGKMRSSTDVFKDVAEQFSHMEDGAAKTALAQEVFGKSGAALIPLLNQGKDGLKASADEAERFGVVVTEAGAKSTEEFNDSLTKVSKLGEGLAQRVAMDLAPAFTKLADELIHSSTTSDTLTGAAKVLSTTLKVLASAGIAIGTVFDLAGQEIGLVASMIVSAVHGDFEGAKESFKQFGKQAGDTFKGLWDRLKTMWGDNPPPGPGDHAENQHKKVAGAAEKIAKAYEKMAQKANEAAEAAKKLAKEVEKSLKEDYGKRNLEVSTGQRKVAAAQYAIDVDRSRASAPLPQFASFGEAMEASAKSFKDEIAIREDARIAEMDGNHKLSESLTRTADDAHYMGQAAANAGDRMKQAFDSIVNKVAGRTGKLAGLVDSAKAGAEAGGPWGAVAAVGVDLLSQSKQFESIVGKLDTFIGYISDTLGRLLGPALEKLGPLLGWVAGLFETLGPLFDLIGKVVGAVVQFVTWIINGIASGWNAIIDGIDAVLGWLGVDLTSLKWKLVSLDTTVPPANDKIDKLGDSAQKAGEEFTNVPAGYRIALARYNAQDPMGGVASSDVATSQPVVNNITINAPQANADEVYDLMIDRLGRKTGRSGDPWNSRFARQEY